MNDRNITVSEIIYLLYFSVMFGAKAAGLYEGMLVYNITIVVGMLLFGLKVLMTEHTLLEYLVIVVLIGMCFVSYFFSGEKGLLYFVTMILGMKGVSVIRVEKVGITILGFFFTLLTFLCVFGIVEDQFVFNERSRFLFEGGIIRHFLRYPNCNVTHTTLLVLFVLIVLVRGYHGLKDLLLSCLFMYLINIYIYYYDASQTGLIVSTCFFILLILLYRREELGRIESFLFQIIYPVTAIMITIVPALLNDRAISWLDVFLHDRVLFLNRRLTMEQWPLFGQRLALSAEVTETMDSNAYIYLLLQLGIVPCLVMSLIMIYTICCLVRDGRKTELAIAFSFCILGLSDAFLYNSSYKNILFIFSGEYIFFLIGKLVIKLPDVFGTPIQVIKAGSVKIEYANNILFRTWSKIGEFLDSIVSVDGVKHILVFFVFSLAASFVAYNTMDTGVVARDMERYAERYIEGIGIHDWEYFEVAVQKLEFLRRSISVGVWSAGAVVLIMTGIDHKKHKAGMKLEQLG